MARDCLIFWKYTLDNTVRILKVIMLNLHLWLLDFVLKIACYIFKTISCMHNYNVSHFDYIYKTLFVADDHRTCMALLVVKVHICLLKYNWWIENNIGADSSE